jgi:Nucleoside-diphosphate-sugar epimerases
MASDIISEPVMRIFVSGATGVLGRRVVPSLVAAGHRVTAVGRSAEKRALLERWGAPAVDTDLVDAAALREAVAGHDTIVNLATAVPHPVWRGMLPGAWREMDRVRRRISANLADAALAGADVTRMIPESFAPIYAGAGDRWIDEAGEVRPGSYNRSVLDAESNVARLTHAGRVGVALRFGLFYGPHDAGTLQIVDSVRRGWFPLFGRAEDYFSFIAHDDAAAAVLASLSVPAGIYNVTEQEPLTRGEIADRLARLLGVKRPRFLPSWSSRLLGSLGETLARSLRISNRKLERASRWAPRYRTLVDGMEAILSASE